MIDKINIFKLHNEINKLIAMIFSLKVGTAENLALMKSKNTTAVFRNPGSIPYHLD